MSEKFACPNCRILLEVNPEQLGKQLRCPVCGLISVFGSPLSGGQTDENGEGWSPIGESRQPANPPQHERNRKTTSFQPLKSSPQAPEGDWREVKGNPSYRNYARDPSKPAAETFVIDESQTTKNQPNYDRRWKIGFVLSLLSLLCFVAYPFCICCLMYPVGPPIPIALGIFGILVTSKSRRGPKAINYFLAGLGLAIALCSCSMWVLLFFLG